MSRCSERGCVFQAFGNTPLCLVHLKEQHDSQAFESHQPTELFASEIISRGRRIGLFVQEYGSIQADSRFA